MRISAVEVGRVLDGWLGRQRWYAGKSRSGSLRARHLATIAQRPHPVQLWIAELAYQTGEVERYQVPIVLRPRLVPGLARALIGAVTADDEAAEIHLYDALHDAEVTGVWLDALARGAVIDGVRFDRRTPAPALPVGATSRPLTAEQSNTSIVYGEAAIMKTFRRIEPGINPDIEIHAALTNQGATHVASLLGHVYATIDGAPWSLAMVQAFVPAAADGWRLATASARELLAASDHPEERSDGDFAAEAARLGRSTAQVHAGLARAFGRTLLTARDLRDRVDQMNARLDAAVREVAELAPFSAGVRRVYRGLAGSGGGVPAQRIHGDLHLGQVLRSARGWILLDFEGEPAKTLAERRGMSSPLRDVAGMLRSFDYAAHYELLEGQGTALLKDRARRWADRNRDAFCAGYAAETGADPRERPLLLAALEADKAVYEAVYEARNRPAWLPVPLVSLRRLVRHRDAD